MIQRQHLKCTATVYETVGQLNNTHLQTNGDRPNKEPQTQCSN